MTKPQCGIRVGEKEVIGDRCADGGKCHHMCDTECFRRDCCVPLTASGLNDDWSIPDEPVLSAGGEPEVPPMPETVDRRPYDDEDPEGYQEGDDDWSSNNPGVVAWLADNHVAIRKALVDRAHLSRLQAEVKRLKEVQAEHDNSSSDRRFYTKQLHARAAKVLGLDGDNTSWFEIVDKVEVLQAEMTKARELVVEGLKHIGYLSNTVLQCSQGDGLAAANERCALAYAALSFNQRAQILLSNQSAPADKE
jgi:hypothetical protein